MKIRYLIFIFVGLFSVLVPLHGADDKLVTYANETFTMQVPADVKYRKKSLDPDNAVYGFTRNGKAFLTIYAGFAPSSISIAENVRQHSEWRMDGAQASGTTYDTDNHQTVSALYFFKFEGDSEKKPYLQVMYLQLAGDDLSAVESSIHSIHYKP